MKKVLIVSPHSDDALFSSSFALLENGLKAEVLTVENDPVRIKEDINLYDFLGIKFHHLSVDFKDESYYGYFKKFKSVNHIDAIGFLEEYFGKEKLEEIKNSVRRFVIKFKRNNPDYNVIAPLGISHPFHYFIHYCLVDLADYFYREFPHSYKKRSKKQMEETLLEYELFKTIPTKEIHDIKFELAKKFYKSQSGLLFYERGYIDKVLPEEIYIKKS